ncbi:MAG TPA: hypothetical protein VMT47_11865 [Polyangia bacterium]|nr:hypothetical protein [Polyangia bacterium]
MSLRHAVAAVVVLAAGGASLVACTESHAPAREAGTDGVADVACSGTGGMQKANGQACGCGGDCVSGFCADGLCCNTACAETCKACNIAAAPGTCSFVPNGSPPRDAVVCPKVDVSTCGLDGTCNGAGACRKYAPGSVCKGGACDGASVGGVYVCDSIGRCKPGPATVCAPFGCDPSVSQCFAACKADADCANNVKCVAGSCGPKPRAAVCAKNADCASGFCADGVCCNVACQGACVACNQVGREGTCWPIDLGVVDPRGQCKDQGAASCGRTGTCDGFGGCTLYRAETICIPSACAGDRLETAGTCNGVGVCRPPGVQACAPFRCANGACKTKCASDADCQAGHACVAGSCGPKQNGQGCGGGGECASTFCVDGVCCADACPGVCRSCGLPSAMGRCTAVPAGAADPRGTCADHGATTCGTDGVCDGAGSCRKYKAGTPCAGEHCDSNVFTPASACNTTGQCVAPPSLACAPFACNGTRCFSACTSDAACVPPNVCDAQSSCGKKTNGSSCSAAVECGSGFCAQGVCCATACAGACKSCALAGAMGTCADVPAGAPDPSNTCVATAASTCGTDGMCEAGACQKYPHGTPCGAASCPAGTATFTPASTCDGAGACVTPGASSCAPFQCGASACRAACSANADCAPPAVCTNGTCGLKAPGATCADGTECGSGFCSQSVCCRTDCTGTCLSCALAATAGTCAPVPSGGTDPTSSCKNAGAMTCGMTGFCDGKGVCEVFAAGTSCAAPDCPVNATTQTLGRVCDGVGTCKPAAMQSCAPYSCNGTACNTTCVADADCAPPAICDIQKNQCGDKHRLGEVCASGADCLTGNACVDGVCCATASCTTCQACNVVGREGTCSAVPADAAEPHDRCAVSPPCGFVGTCDGAGACRNAPASTSCGTASCTDATVTPVGFCNGAGTCKQTPMNCGVYKCGAGAMCLTSCASDGDCVTGFSCADGACTNLTPNGGSCTDGSQCVSGHCVEQVCCGTASCTACSSCAVTGKAGSCQPVPKGGNDPLASCLAMAASTCGTDGVCNGAGSCALYPAGTTCMPASCDTATSMLTAASTCDGAGMCVAGATSSCAPYACAGAACKAAPCGGDNDCAAGATCDPGTSTCQ